VVDVVDVEVTQTLGGERELVGDEGARGWVTSVLARALLVAVGEQEHIIRAALRYRVARDLIDHRLARAFKRLGERCVAVGTQLFVVGVVLYTIKPRQHITSTHR
jgi:hypothetical protein